MLALGLPGRFEAVSMMLPLLRQMPMVWGQRRWQVARLPGFRLHSVGLALSGDTLLGQGHPGVTVSVDMSGAVG